MEERLYFEDLNLRDPIFNKISVKLIKEVKLIPYHEEDSEVFVLKIVDNIDYNNQIIKLLFDKDIKYRLISYDDYEKMINYLSKSNLQGFYEEIITKNTLENPVTNYVLEDKKEFYHEEIKNNQVVRTIDNIIEKAILYQASDIHFEPSFDLVKVRIRLDGELQKINDLSLELYQQIVSRIKVLSNLDITKHLLAQDGKLKYKYNNDTYDIRVSILPTASGERISLRILDDFSNNVSLDDLFIEDKAKEELLNIIKKQTGLTLVVGATGSGKTTTLYSFLKLRNDEQTNIITVEDPIEYSIEGISQVQVDENIGLTFQETLRSVLRQDPDVFMIGEIRDEASGEIAIRSATTGHTVFSTLHANDSITAISRLLDMNIPSYLVANALKAIVYQRLYKKRCPKCLKQIIVNNKCELINEGCPNCHNTGFKGRVGIGEVLLIDDEIRRSIINNTYYDVINNYIKNKKFIPIEKQEKKASKIGLIKK